MIIIFLPDFRKKARTIISDLVTRPGFQASEINKVEGDYLKVPKLGLVVARIHKQLEGKLKTVTISKNPDGKYFASLLFEDGIDKPEQSLDGKAIGIDLVVCHDEKI